MNYVSLPHFQKNNTLAQEQDNIMILFYMLYHSQASGGVLMVVRSPNNVGLGRRRLTNVTKPEMEY